LPDNWRVDHRDHTRNDLENLTQKVEGQV
jgi:hypothetical protein